MISALSWLPRGAAAAVPAPAPLNEEELAALKRTAADAAAGILQADDASESSDSWETDGDDDEDAEDGNEGVEAAVARARAAAAAIASSAAAPGSKKKGAKAGKSSTSAGALEAALAELDMDHYDSEDEEGEAAVVARALGGRSAGIILDDPYLKAGGGDDSSSEEGRDDALVDMDSEERDDYTLRDSDLLLVAARHEDDVSTLEVWVYEEAGTSTGGEANIYVHRDVLLPALPLCLAWLDCDPGGGPGKRNIVAVGTMDPGIELWDLDVADAVEPAVTLGGLDPAAAGPAAAAAAAATGARGSKAAKKRARSAAAAAAGAANRAALPGGHTDAVLGLAWNRTFRNVLASASADCTVRVWDVAAGRAEHTLTHHTGKVQAVAWNPADPPVLLSGSFDKQAALADVRSPAGTPLMWRVSADVEALAWNPSSPTQFLVSAEDGLVVALDARAGAGSKPLFTLAAHSRPTCALSFCPAGAPGLLATASTDKFAKLWDVSSGAPRLLASREAKLGALFSAGFCADVPYLLAMAGAKGEVGVWDVRSATEVAARYPELMVDAAASAQL